MQHMFDDGSHCKQQAVIIQDDEEVGPVYTDKCSEHIGQFDADDGGPLAPRTEVCDEVICTSMSLC
jgi:hypothetical protein